MILRHILPLYAILAVSSAAILLEPPRCCSGDNFLIKNHCADNESIALDCPLKYMLDPEFDNEEAFQFDKDANLLSKHNSYKTVVVPKYNYCVANLEGQKAQIAIVCFSTDEPEDKWFSLRAICGFLSVAFLTMTLIVYSLVRGLRDIQGLCIMHSIFALAVSYLNLGILQMVDFGDTGCVLYAFLNYFTFMVTFFWLNVTSFHIWKTVVLPNIPGTDKQWYSLYVCYGYGIPSIFLLSTVITHTMDGSHIKPNFGKSKCWFHGTSETWTFFYGPITILLLINLVLFIWSTSKLWSQSTHINESTLKSLKFKVALYVKLFLIMGLLWFFEVISAALDGQNEFLDYVWVVTDYINALQGALIFTLLVVFRKRALRGLAKRGLFGVRFPDAWKTFVDEEMEEAQEVETRLSNGIDIEK